MKKRDANKQAAAKQAAIAAAKEAKAAAQQAAKAATAKVAEDARKEVTKIKLEETKDPKVNRRTSLRVPDPWKEIRLKLKPLAKTYNKFREKRRITKQKENERRLKEEEEQKLREEAALRLQEQEARRLKKQKKIKEEKQVTKKIAKILIFVVQITVAAFLVLMIVYYIF